MDKIKEVMGLVDEYAKYERQCTRFAIEAKLRELLAKEHVAFLHYPPKKPELARVDFCRRPTHQEVGRGFITIPLVKAIDVIGNDSKGM